MQLTRRALWSLLPLAIWLAAAAWRPWLGWGAGLWLVMVAALLIADWQLAVGRDMWEVARRHDARLSLAVSNPVRIDITMRGGLRTTPVWMRDEIPVNFKVDNEDRILTGTVDPRMTTTLRYAVTPPRRGDYAFGDIHVRWGTPLGLLTRQARFDAAAPVKVFPNLVDIRKYDLLLRRNRLWELGVRQTRLLGAGSEFERLREYTPDDEYRRINWAATARRGRPISIEFETERSQTIVALLDTGRMMRSPVGDVAKLDYAVNAVLLLAYVAAQKGDQVGLLAFADAPQTWVAPRSGKVQFQRLLAQLYAVESQAVEPDYTAAAAYLAAKQSKRSLVLIFSDLTGALHTDQLATEVAHLQRRHLVLLVTMRDPTVQGLVDAPVRDSAGLYARTVAERLLDERQAMLEALQRRGVLTLDVPADELSIAVINRYLEIKARSLL